MVLDKDIVDVTQYVRLLEKRVKSFSEEYELYDIAAHRAHPPIIK